MQLAMTTPGDLLPGGYASVSLDLPDNADVLNIPASA